MADPTGDTSDTRGTWRADSAPRSTALASWIPRSPNPSAGGTLLGFGIATTCGRASREGRSSGGGPDRLDRMLFRRKVRRTGEVPPARTLVAAAILSRY